MRRLWIENASPSCDLRRPGGLEGPRRPPVWAHGGWTVVPLAIAAGGSPCLVGADRPGCGARRREPATSGTGMGRAVAVESAALCRDAVAATSRQGARPACGSSLRPPSHLEETHAPSVTLTATRSCSHPAPTPLHPSARRPGSRRPGLRQAHARPAEARPHSAPPPARDPAPAPARRGSPPGDRPCWPARPTAAPTRSRTAGACPRRPTPRSAARTTASTGSTPARTRRT